MSSYRKHPPYESLTSQWGGMKLREDLGWRIKNWLDAFSDYERPLLLNLLEHFYYYGEERIKEKVQNLFTSFCELCGDNVYKTTYTKAFKELGVAYSDIVFSAFWLENNLADYAENNLYELLLSGEIPSILAIVDDFSGTGNTFIKTVNSFLEVAPALAKSEIYFLVIHITEAAKQRIDTYSSSVGVNINIVSLDNSQAAFKGGYLYEEVASIRYREGYSKICSRYGLTGDFVFGFEEIEALVAFHYNTPNNTLGLFWQDLTGFCALFPRHKKKATSLKSMQDAVKRRKLQKGIIAAYGIDDKRQSAFMVYILAKGKDFSLECAQTDFGLTSDQLDTLLKGMIQDDYITYQDGVYVATEKLKSHLFVSRLKKVKKAYQTKPLKDTCSFSLHEEYMPVNFK